MISFRTQSLLVAARQIAVRLNHIAETAVPRDRDVRALKNEIGAAKMLLQEAGR